MYNRAAAVLYALRYIQYYNPAYPDWTRLGGDCTNFISQCLYAGGMPMRGVPGTREAAENWNNWFSIGNETNVVNVSSTWRGTAAFRDYWQRHASGFRTFFAMDLEAYTYGQIGDVISLLNVGGTPYHMVIIVERQNTDFKVAGHTDSYVRDGKPYFLSERSLENGFILYKFV
jgi:hypothetical protein